MSKKELRYFLVQEDILPEAILKTVMAKELLLRGEANTVNEAVEKVDLSRSAFYKYKDKVFPFHQWSKGKIVTLALLMEHRPGVLSTVLNIIASVKGSILTINQNLPLQGLANATLSIETAEMNQDLEELLRIISEVTGVRDVRLVGQN
ncbi:ACT domain-containing protein [Desulforamulus putei]|uniref:ACT domain-containing protein n=1 Tax=Desulforamulus putei TaxID=74701 RepID=UPI0009342A21|nr:ACT domain-containing protein [Desulforamulus putei]